MSSPSTSKSAKRRLTKRNLKKAYPSNRKERGEWVELLFMANAARLGLKVMRPHGDSARFDVVVGDGSGELHRVQVKSTTNKRQGDYSCHCSWQTTAPGVETKRGDAGRPASRNCEQQYSTDQIDFVAAYVVPEDAWFIIPAADLPTKSMYLPRRERAEQSRYGPFLEAWHLLGADGRGLTIHASIENDLLVALLKAKVAEECAR